MTENEFEFEGTYKMEGSEEIEEPEEMEDEEEPKMSDERAIVAHHRAQMIKELSRMTGWGFRDIWLNHSDDQFRGDLTFEEVSIFL